MWWCLSVARFDSLGVQSYSCEKALPVRTDCRTYNDASTPMISCRGPTVLLTLTVTKVAPFIAKSRFLSK